VREAGGVPRRQDWSGQRSEPATTAQRKWMREHPRWPSSSCVARHFGTWSAALEAAALPARAQRFEDSVAERVAAARRLAGAGVPVAAIAAALCVSVSSVHNYLRAAPCPGCGGPVTNPNAARCAACTAHEATVARTWTRDAVRTALRAWEAEQGHMPTYREWTPSRTQAGRWEAESPRWPSAAVVCALYGAWNAALQDAGAGPRTRRWTDDAVRAALAAFWARTGRPPTAADLAAPAWDGPHARTLRRRYGSLQRAWDAVGPVPAEPVAPALEALSR
jgi:hypothetical protein